MKKPEYEMFLESFIEHAKSQDSSLVDGSVMVFIPSGGSATDASIFSWISESTDKMQSEIWHDSFVAMLFALLGNGVDGDTLHEIVHWAVSNAGSVRAVPHGAGEDEEILN